MGALRTKLQHLLRAPSTHDASTLPLLRRLRVKFIAVNMALAALVLAGSFTAICYMDFRNDIDEVYSTLTRTANRALERPQLVPEQNPLVPFDMNTGAGVEPDQTQRGPSIQPSESDKTTDQDQGTIQKIPTDQENSDFSPPQIGGDPRTNGETALPVAVYYCEGTTAMELPEHSSASVPKAVLHDALPAALVAPGDHGSLDSDGLLFAKQSIGPVTVVAFADNASASAWKSLALVLAIVGVAALAVLFLLNLVFSRWALRPVQQAWIQQQQFIADASHELKTPLTVILANNAILRQHGNETVASQGQWIESTQMEAERMQGLVTDMLDLARSSTTAAATPRAPLDFSRLVEGEALTFESVAFERGLTWESSVQGGVEVQGDVRRLERLVAVLLDNACKYTNPGGRVEVSLRTEERNACLRVRNTGDPIDPADLEHLFDRFFRVSKARTHGALAAMDGSRPASPNEVRTTESRGQTTPDSPNGYGLGLAIAREIAQAHKGTLTATSTTAEGTTFILRLPLA